MHVPANVVDNDRLSRLMETTDDWIRRRTGIVTRRYAGLREASSDLAVPAAEQAVAAAGAGERTHQIEAEDYFSIAGITGIALSPDGKTVDTGSVDTSVSLWDLPRGKLRRRWKQEEGEALTRLRRKTFLSKLGRP